ncbi:putative Ig domain-containing protein [Undibacterium sp. Ren11W]|uniref:putative Ig domain-containing protein n=1 Tax=Undibacterium sp. Ren11W TaxID=3413045 RepID=UPI003BF1ADA1
MPTKEEYAQLSTRVYLRTGKNRTPIADGWSEVAYTGNASLSGFSAGIYQNGSEIVIAYTGTNEKQAADFVLGNIPIGLGLPSAQVTEAMLLYFETKAKYPAANITFTGHSLGGGLASLMAMFFNKEATIFDPAPFEITARNMATLGFYQIEMTRRGLSDDAFNDYTRDASGTLFNQRELKIKGYSLESEILEPLRAASATIEGSHEVTPIGRQTLLEVGPTGLPGAMISLHSMTLLTEMLMSEKFRDMVKNTPDSLKQFFDTELYATDPQYSADMNFLDGLLIAEMGNKAAKILDKFADEIGKFKGDAGVAQTQLKKELIIVVMEYFYKKGTDANSIFKIETGTLNFKYSDIGATSYKSLPLLAKAVKELLSTAEKPYADQLIKQNAWHIQQGTDAMNWTADGTPQNDAAIGGTGVDVMDGGAGIDMLIGGAAGDVLTGGTGNDILMGGLGDDIYLFKSGDGSDLIVDTDGLGRIKYDGLLLAGGNAVGTTGKAWQEKNGGKTFNYLLTDWTENGETFKRLSIQGPDGGMIIKRWEPGQLGITFKEAQAVKEDRTILGDLAPIEDAGAGSDDLGNPLTNGSAAGRNDYLRDGAGNDLIRGLGGDDQILASRGGDDQIYGGTGNDAISGGDGNDQIYGEDNNDLLSGGEGNDLLDGGVGDDILYGDNGDDILQLGSGRDRAFGENGSDFLIASDVPGQAVANVYLDGNAGNDSLIGAGGSDLLLGGRGEDYLVGGAGNDFLFGDTSTKYTSTVQIDWSVSVSESGLFSIYHWKYDTTDGTMVSLADDSGYFSSVNGVGEDDVLDGGSGDDWLLGGGGDDRLYGGDGNDVMHAGRGMDFLDGEAGDDRVVGNGGDDILYGGEGNDTLSGDGSSSPADQDGRDQLYGGDGDDRLFGDGGDDQLIGGSGDDEMQGDNTNLSGERHGADTLLGGLGKDLLIGQGGSDTLYGGDGDDELQGDSGSGALDASFHGDDVLDGGDGNDALLGQGGRDTLIGGAGDDVLYGDGGDGDTLAANYQGDDLLDGGSGNDSLYGGGGKDSLQGGAGNDYLDGGAGADYMAGGEGEDNYVVDDEGDVIIETDGAGSEAANAAPMSTPNATSIDNVNASVSYTLGANLENLWLKGSASINGSGNELNNLMSGNSGVNILSGGAGNDTLDGGAGADTLIGGSGNDYYVVDNTGDILLENVGEGMDYVQTSVSFTLSENLEKLEAIGSAAINLTGNALANGLFGNGANNIFTGAAGNDYLMGAGGDDVYVFNRGDGNDTIDNTDFSHDSAHPELLAAIDVLRFGAGISDTDVTAYRSGDDLVLKIKGSNDQVGVLGYYAEEVLKGTITSDQKIDRVEFANGMVWDQARIQSIIALGEGNNGPGGNLPSLNLHAIPNKYFSYTLPLDAFIDADQGDTIAYSVKMSNGSALPDWLNFDAASRTVSGTPAEGHDGYLDMVFWGRDNYGLEAAINATLEVGANHAPTLGGPIPDIEVSRGEIISYTLSSWVFVDQDRADILTYSATLADGSALPSWLSFNALTRKFSGAAPELGRTSVQVVARDNDGLTVADTFDFVVLSGELPGTAGDDVLIGRARADIIDGGTGNDTISGGDGDDVIDGGAGNDTLDGGNGNNTYRFGAGFGNDTISSTRYSYEDGTDVVVFANQYQENNLFFSRFANSADLTFGFSLSTDSVTIRNFFSWNSGGISSLVFDGGSTWSLDKINAQYINQLIAGASAGDVRSEKYIYGTASSDVLIGDGSDQDLEGSGGDDVLVGGAGSDIYFGGDGADTFALEGGGGDQVWDFGSGDTVQLWNGVKLADLVFKKSFSWLSDFVIIRRNTNDQVEFDLDSDSGIGYRRHLPSKGVIRLSDGTKLTSEMIIAAALRNSDGDDVISNFTPDGREMLGLAGNDIIEGGYGDDILDGGTGNDLLIGFSGFDTYRFGRGYGIDTVDNSPFQRSGVQAAQGNGRKMEGRIEMLDLRPDDVTLNKDSLGNLLISIKGSTDQLIVDNYLRYINNEDAIIDYCVKEIAFANGIVWSPSDVLALLKQSWLGYDDLLPGDAQVNHLNGTASRELLRGFDGDDQLLAGDGDDRLEGGLGKDYLSGEQGNDVYFFNRGDGQDTIDNTDILAAVDILLFGAGIAESDVQAFRSGNNWFFKIKGSTDQIALVNYYAADTTINGEAADHKIDKLEFSNGAVWNQAMIQTVVDRATNNRAPTVVSYLPTLQAKANSVFSYTVAANTITDPDSWDSITYSFKMKDGSALPAWLNFDASTRVFSGTPGAGNVGTLSLTLWGTDNYGSSAGEYVTMNIGAANRAPVLATALPDQAVGQGALFSYTVSSAAFTDPDTGDVLTYSATQADGSALPSWLTFNANTRVFSGTPTSTGTVSIKVVAKDSSNLAATDIFDVVVSLQNLSLNGTANADTLTGGAGNDTLNGLAGNDILIGGAGNDTLNGGAGNDTMTGGTGDDIYVLDSASDVVNELANEGSDTVQSAINYTLGASSNLENLTLTGTAASGTGNSLANIIIGNSSANILDGGAGVDTLIGGAGNDIYVVDNSADVVSENLNEGTDLVNSSAIYTLSANLENLTLTGTSAINGTGNALANTITGNSGNNILDGGAGIDSLIGGAGNDIYLVDNTVDVVTEVASGGTDLVQAWANYTLSNEVENLSLMGTAAINGTGNNLVNILSGNSGNNILDGGAGADTMIGGAGNDSYLVDSSSDIVTENAGEGSDQVQSSATYALSANIEALFLTGTGSINGTGNAIDNLLVGNSGINTLNGAAGNDILQGAAGVDTLTDTLGNNVLDGGAGNDIITAGVGNDFILGGTGNDTITTGQGVDVIAFNRGDGMDIVNASTIKDNSLSLGKGIKYADLLFKKSANDLILVTGASEQITVKDWYANSANHSIANLQIVIEGTSDYVAASTNKLNNKKIEQFNFDGLVTKFDQARAATPSITSWALSASLLEFYLAGSDTAAIGGDLAYQYAKNGNLSSFSAMPAQSLLASPQFGNAQGLQNVAALQDASPRLM